VKRKRDYKGEKDRNQNRKRKAEEEKGMERTKEEVCFQYTGESFCSESNIPQYAVVVKGCISLYTYVHIYNVPYRAV
jgi:hypothetical protein